MPSPSIFNIGQNSISWSITDLSSDWNITHYNQAYIKINGVTSSPVYPPTSGSSRTTGTGSFSGLSAGTTYTAFGYVRTPPSNNEFPAGSFTFTTASPPSPPSPVTGLQVTSRTTNSISVSWNTASGATGYNIFRNDVYITSVAGTSYTHTGLVGGTQYKLTATPYNGNGSGTGQSIFATTLSPDPPSPVTGLQTINKTVNTITVAWNSAAGANGYYMYRNDVFVTSVTSTSYVHTGLVVGTQYKLSVIPYNDNGSGVGQSIFDTPLSPRPNNYSWTYAGLHPTTNSLVTGSNKLTGYGLYVHNTEWSGTNGLCARINEFRTYKALGTATFTTVSSGTLISATIFNQAITALSSLSSYFTGGNTLPSTKSSGNNISASDFNKLKDCMNSVV